jgi:hypothetical protein
MMRSFFSVTIVSFLFALGARAQDANFDAQPEGPLGDLYTENGVLFQNPDIDTPGQAPVFMCDEADGDLAGMPGFSGPNVLGFSSITPGPHAAFGRVLSFEMVSPQPTGEVHLELFDLGTHPGNLITLDALAGHVVVNSQTVVVQNGGPFQHFSLSLTGVPFDFVRVRGTGPFDNGAFFSVVDNVHFGPLAPGTTFCSGDGTGTACPCGNSSALGAGLGCASSLGFGARLRSSGTASLANDTITLVGTQMPDAPCLYFQGTAQTSGGAGAAFGDGLRCAGGSIVRLATVMNSGGASQYPSGAQTSVSVRGQVTTPGVREYQIWYRNAAAFCTPSTFNLTNGQEITWAP